ncbi:MAG: leucine-rich repeat protein [Kiritimatiellae bacterium]|nr:leucine-rich repeat protein [Kiritimatiellia bacterium]
MKTFLLMISGLITSTFLYAETTISENGFDWTVESYGEGVAIIEVNITEGHTIAPNTTFVIPPRLDEKKVVAIADSAIGVWSWGESNTWHNVEKIVFPKTLNVLLGYDWMTGYYTDKQTRVNPLGEPFWWGEQDASITLVVQGPVLKNLWCSQFYLESWDEETEIYHCDIIPHQLELPSDASYRAEWEATIGLDVLAVDAEVGVIWNEMAVKDYEPKLDAYVKDFIAYLESCKATCDATGLQICEALKLLAQLQTNTEIRKILTGSGFFKVSSTGVWTVSDFNYEKLRTQPKTVIDTLLSTTVLNPLTTAINALNVSHTWKGVVTLSPSDKVPFIKNTLYIDAADALILKAGLETLIANLHLISSYNTTLDYTIPLKPIPQLGTMGYAPEWDWTWNEALWMSIPAIGMTNEHCGKVKIQIADDNGDLVIRLKPVREYLFDYMSIDDIYSNLEWTEAFGYGDYEKDVFCENGCAFIVYYGKANKFKDALKACDNELNFSIGAEDVYDPYWGAYYDYYYLESDIDLSFLEAQTQFLNGRNSKAKLTDAKTYFKNACATSKRAINAILTRTSDRECLYNLEEKVTAAELNELEKAIDSAVASLTSPAEISFDGKHETIYLAPLFTLNGPDRSNLPQIVDGEFLADSEPDVTYCGIFPNRVAASEAMWNYEVVNGKAAIVASFQYWCYGDNLWDAPYDRPQRGCVNCNGRGKGCFETSPAIPWETEGIVCVPARLGGCPVTTIGPNAFTGCENISEIIISEGITTIDWEAFQESGISRISLPKSLTEVGYWMFDGCPNLCAIEVHPENPNFKSIDGYLCDKSGTRLIAAPTGLVSATIPEGIQTICDGAFHGALVERVRMPESVTEIECEAFVNCWDLTSIRIPESVKTIGECAFQFCEYLSNVKLSTGLETIGEYAFDQCPLERIVIPETVSSIGECAFTYCYKSGEGYLHDIYFEGIPPNTTAMDAFDCKEDECYVCIMGETRVGYYPLQYADAWQKVMDDEGMWRGLRMRPDLRDYEEEDWYSSEGNYLYDNGVLYEQFGDEETYLVAVLDPTIQSLTIPKNCEEIGDFGYNLRHCTNLTAINVEAGNPYYKSIGGVLYRYENWDGEEHLYLAALPPAIQTLTIPKNCEEIGDLEYNLRHWINLTAINVEAGNPYYKSIGGVLYRYENWERKEVLYLEAIPPAIKTFTIPKNCEGFNFYYGDRYYNPFPNLTAINVEAGNPYYKSIGGVLYRYENWDGEEYLYLEVLPPTIKTLTIPKNCEPIVDFYYTYRHCTNLTAINVEAGNPYYKSIDGVLYRYEDWGEEGEHLYLDAVPFAIKTFTIPKNCEMIYIGQDFGVSFPNLTAINVEAGNPYYKSIGGVLYRCETWDEEGDRLRLEVIPPAIKTFTIPRNCEEIGEIQWEIRNCTNLTAINVENGHPYYQSFDGVLYTCHDYGEDGQWLYLAAIPPAIKTFTIPRNCEGIGEIQWVISACTNLTAINVEDGHPYYWSNGGVLYAFEESGLSSRLEVIPAKKGHVVVPEGVDYIDEYAYQSENPLTITFMGAELAYSDFCYSRETLFYSEEYWDEWTDECYTIDFDVKVEYLAKHADRWENYLDEDYRWLGCPTSMATLSYWTYTTTKNSATITGRTVYNTDADLELPSTINGLPVTAIAANAFKNDPLLTSVILPEGVITIGANAFMDCVNLDIADVKLPSTLKTIANGAFSGCKGATVIEIVPGEVYSEDFGGYKLASAVAGVKLDGKTGTLMATFTKPGTYDSLLFNTMGDLCALRYEVGEIPVLSLDVTGGDATCKVTGAGAYLFGKAVTLKATAGKGYVFAGWYEDADFDCPCDSTLVDYRNLSYTYTMGKTNVTIYARFVTTEEDKLLTLTVQNKADNATVAPFVIDGDAELALIVGSHSLPNVTVKGLPAGMSFTAKPVMVKGSKTEVEYPANTIYGTPTKPGIYTVTVSLTNTTIKKAVTKTFEIKVSNLKDELIQVEGLYGPYVPGASYAIKISAAEGCSVTGLPAGMKWTAKDIYKKGSKTEIETFANSVYGVPTKPGNYTVYFTKTVNKEKHTATATFVVAPYPQLTVDIPESSDGKIGGKVTGAGTFAANKKVTLKATPNKGYVFAGWYKDPNFEYPCDSTLMDYRNPSYTYVMGEDSTQFYARFVTIEEDAAALYIVMPDHIDCAVGDPLEPIVVQVESYSLPKVTIKGLPAGLTFDTKSFTISGTPKKVGDYAVTFTATTQKTTTDTKVVTFAVEKELMQLEMADENWADQEFVKGTGLSELCLTTSATSSVKSVKATKLPPGLKVVNDGGVWKIIGTPTTPGTYTVTLTLTTAFGSTMTLQIQMEVRLLPSWATGTFSGAIENQYWEWDDYWEEDYLVRIGGTASIKVNDKGWVNGSLYFWDGASGEIDAQATVIAQKDGTYLLKVKSKWYDEDGVYDGSSTSYMTIDGSEELFYDDGDDYEYVRGTLTK